MEKIEKRKKSSGGKIRTVTSLERTKAPTIEPKKRGVMRLEPNTSRFAYAHFTTELLTILCPLLTF
jgi:hypothetical protein